MNTLACFSSISWGNVWAFLTAGATILLFLTAYFQLNDIKKTSKEEFLHKLKTDFFTEEARRLITIIDNNWLIFEQSTKKGLSSFKVNIPNDLNYKLQWSMDINRIYYTTQEVDDFLLGPLEDVGILLNNNTIEIKDTIQQFEYYIEVVWENKEIAKYVKWVRKDKRKNSEDIYSNLEIIYNKLK